MNHLDFSQIFNFLPGNYIILLPDAPKFTIVAYNETRAGETFTRTEDIGRGIFEAFPDNPDDPKADGVAKLRYSLEKVIAEKQPHEMLLQKYDIAKKDRSGFEERYWLPKNIPVLNAQGEIDFIIHHVSDVTAQVLAEKRGEENRQNFADFLDQSSSPFAILSGRDFVFTYANPAYIELMNNRQLVGKKMIEAIPELYNQPFLKQLEHVYSTGEPYHGIEVPATAHFKGSDHETTRFFNLSYTALKTDDAISGVLAYAYDVTELIGVMRDISEQKAFGEEMKRQVDDKTRDLQIVNQELERSNKELEQFAYVTSHDLQEPLRKIQIYGDMLLKGTGLSESTISYMDKINASASRMTGLIRELLNYARLSRADEQFGFVDLNEILHGVLLDFELLISQSGADIEIDQLATISAIPLQINQLFYNLLGNALKFAKPGVPPKIRIRAKKLEKPDYDEYPTLQKDKAYYQIRFIDNGIGFEEVYAEKIFDFFQRLHQRLDYSGYGIGLAMCKRIVQNHKGVIQAKGAMGEGATFTVILPFD